MSDRRSSSFGRALTLLTDPAFQGSTRISTVGRAASLAAESIHGADMAGIALLEDGEIFTGAASNELVEEIDSFQYATNQGPCLEAMTTDGIVTTGSTTFDSRWPRFCKLASTKGVESIMSAPLVSDKLIIGSLNLYAYRPDSFDERDRDEVVRFAGAAADLIAEQGASRTGD